MKQGAKILACAVAGTGLCFSAWADVEEPANDNPYTAIVVRNIFGLKPPPPPPSVEAPKTPPPNINLTGISTLGGTKRAMMKIPAVAAKPNQPAKGDQFFMLSEGDRDGELEVLEINAKSSTVKINYAGTMSTLDFTNNGIKVAFGPAPGAPGGIALPPGAPGSAIPTLPRPLRLPTPGGSIQPRPVNYTGVPSPTGSQASPGYGYQGNPSVYSPGGTASLQLNSTTPDTQAAAANPVHQLPVEQQMIMIEAERVRTQPAVSAGLMPPLPPTAISQLDAPPQQTMPTQPIQGRRFPLRAPGLPALPP